jgi:hypothetical protein
MTLPRNADFGVQAFTLRRLSTLVHRDEKDEAGQLTCFVTNADYWT